MRKYRVFDAVRFLIICCAVICGCGHGGGEGTILIGAGEAGSVNPASPVPEAAAEQEKSMIRVYVCGAVANPGVVPVPAGSRVEDALAAAGGFRDDAGREAVNLADWVADGQMLYFPTEEEAALVSGELSGSGLVNINRADAAGLCTLPGIGESRAADIIAYREKNGGFDSCEDIMKVPGIKESVYEKICDRITVR